MSDELFWLIVLEVSGVPIRDWLAVSHLAMNKASMATGVEVSRLPRLQPGGIQKGRGWGLRAFLGVFPVTGFLQLVPIPRCHHLPMLASFHECTKGLTSRSTLFPKVPPLNTNGLEPSQHEPSRSHFISILEQHTLSFQRNFQTIYEWGVGEVCISVHTDVTSQSSSTTCHRIFTQVSHCAWSSLIQLGCVASLLSPCSPCRYLEVYVGARDQKPGPEVSAASTLLTEPFPQLLPPTLRRLSGVTLPSFSRASMV